MGSSMMVDLKAAKFVARLVKMTDAPVRPDENRRLGDVPTTDGAVQISSAK